MTSAPFALLQFADNMTVWAIIVLALCCFILEFNLILAEGAPDWRQQVTNWMKVLPVLLSALPLLGLLGTITGLLDTFQTMARGSSTNQQALLSGGIADALVTTQLGLIMVIPGVLMFSYIRFRFRRQPA
jgi:biopolymer transport protein ExbB